MNVQFILFHPMLFGMYPFCVQEDHIGNLLFRRVAGPNDRDRQRRTADAVESLQALESVRQYHATLTDGNQELHVQSNCVVAWPISAPRTAHLTVVPDLLAWTQWELDGPWIRWVPYNKKKERETFRAGCFAKTHCCINHTR